MMEQSKIEAGAIINMNDQINMRFESLENKML
jgi:hypothetical protein